MKKIISNLLFTLTTAFLLLPTACSSDDSDPTRPIDVDPGDELVLSYRPQQTQVTIRSVGDWTLEGRHDWCEVSRTSGRNGDQIVIEAKRNTTGRVRAAVYTIHAAGYTTQLAVKQRAGTVDMHPSLALADTEVTDVILNYSLESEDLELVSKRGVCYSETDQVDDGTDFVLDGPPAVGTVEVTLSGLTPLTKYYIWAYVEDIDGMRVYQAEPVEATPGLSPVSEEFSVSGYSHTIDVALTLVSPAAKVGICWNTTGEPTMEDNYSLLDNPILGRNTVSSLGNDIPLKNSTRHYVRVFAVKNSGTVMYSTRQVTVTTLTDPFSARYGSSIGSGFYALSELGPSQWAAQGMHGNAFMNGMVQGFEGALQAYDGSHYHSSRLLFDNMADGTPCMVLIIRTSASGFKTPNDTASGTSQLGAWVYRWDTDEYGRYLFTLLGYDNSRSGSKTFYQSSAAAPFRAEIDKYLNYWTQTPFYVDWNSPSYSALSYQDMRLIPIGEDAGDRTWWVNTRRDDSRSRAVTVLD